MKRLLVILLALVLALGLAIPMTAPAAADAIPNLVGLWHFDSVDTTVSPYTTPDSSGQDNTGCLYPTDSEPTLVPGKFGQALSFDGTDDYVQVGNESNFDFDINDSFTIEAWVNTSSDALMNIVSKYLDSSPNTGYQLIKHKRISNEEGPNRLYFFLTNNSSNNQIVVFGSTDITDGKWHHVAVTYDGTAKASGVQIYVDGIPETMHTRTSCGQVTGSILNNLPLQISGRQGSNWAFSGFIDEVRIWDSVLTVSQLDDMTPPVIDPNVEDFGVYTAGTLLDLGVNDGSGTGVKDVEATLDGSPIIASAELTVGIYEYLVITATDYALNESTETIENIVVYDPTGGEGHVTGGGWIMSPAGADRANPEADGKATFGFVSKYQKGASVPTGQTEFQFKAGDLNFHSTEYQWLVVNQNGTNAQFKGSGTINGEGDYKFMLWAGDGEPDTFRIKIWTGDGTENVRYDNGMDQAIGGGSIIVHTK